MATVQSFNGLLRSFIEELCHAFPEDATLHSFLEGLDVLIKANVRKPMDLFMQALGPHAQLILAKDPRLFDQPINLGGTLDIKTYWDSPDLSDASREAIWQYLHTLYLLSSTVSLVPPQMLETVESLAQDCATKIQNGELDMNGVVSTLLKGDAGGISELLGSVGGDNALETLSSLGLGAADDPSLANLLGALGGSQLDPFAAILAEQPSSSARRSSAPGKNKNRASGKKRTKK